MLYVSENNGSVYGVVDTDDGTISYKSASELFDAVFKLGVPIKGVFGPDRIIVSKPDTRTQQERMKAWLTKAELLGVREHWVFDRAFQRAVRYDGPGGIINIPPVRVINGDCFGDLRHVLHDNEVCFNMPDTVEVIEQVAFADITISERSCFDMTNVMSIEKYAFSDVYVPGQGLYLQLPNIAMLSNSAFRQHSDGDCLRGIYLGGSLTDVPHNCFNGNKGLKYVVLGPTISKICASAFASSFCLRRIVVTGEMMYSADNAFDDCCVYDGMFSPNGRRLVDA